MTLNVLNLVKSVCALFKTHSLTFDIVRQLLEIQLPSPSSVKCALICRF